MIVLDVKDLAIGYWGGVVADGIGFSLRAGSITCLLGPNGVGKTTLFRTLLGLIPPLGGDITLGEERLAALSGQERARRIAYVPQAIAGAFAYTVLDLVLMGRTPHLGAFATPDRRDGAIAMAALELLGIAELARRDSEKISGGQLQLALIARALAQQADIVVMDEPTASLDFSNRVMLLERVRGLASRGLAVLMSTHEPDQAFAIADQVVVLGRNNLFCAGPAADLLTSRLLSVLYGIDLVVERTPSGRRAVSIRSGG
jgi:iron complex transport system ATP-binding protein